MADGKPHVQWFMLTGLARILKPLVGKSTHHVPYIRDFIQKIKGIKLEEDEYISSYDVKTLFTSVPVESAIKIIMEQLKHDKELHQNTHDSRQCH